MSFQPWFIDGRSRTEGGAFGALRSSSKPAPPVISGDPYQGQELTSTANREWSINGVPTGVVGNTFIVPESVLMGDEITQEGSNVLTVMRIPLAIGINVNTELAGDTGSDGFRLPARNDTGYDCRVYWGDGTYSDIDAYNHPDLEHTYEDGGVYDIQISGTFRGFYFSNAGDKGKLLRIDQWGDTGQAPNQGSSFFGCVNLTTLPDDMTLPNLTNGTNMFSGTSITTLPDGMTLTSLTGGNYMFRDTNLTTLPGGMTLPNLTNGTTMFVNTNLTTLPDGMTLPSLTNGNQMFWNTPLTTLPDDMALPNLTNGEYMFADTSITTLPDDMALPNLTNGRNMFVNTNLTTLPDGMTLPNLTGGYSMFANTSITTLPDGMTLPSLTNGQVMFQNTPITTLPDGMTLSNLTRGDQMFQSTNLTTLPDGMTLPNLTHGPLMFNVTLITTTRYSQLLIDLSEHNPNDNVTFHGGSAKYNEIAAPARYALYMRQWDVTDGGADFVTPLLFGLPHAESLLWSTHTGQWAIDGAPVVGETGQTFTIPDDVTDGQEITQLDSDPLIVSNLDPDALNYILRVEDADQYPLEPAVKTAINDLFLAWKDAPAPIAANNWAAIAAGTGLLMAGPRTLAGALVPLDPNMPNPTNTNFVQGDYNRKTGLKGGTPGQQKWIDSNFGFHGIDYDDLSIGVYRTELTNNPPGVGEIGASPWAGNPDYPSISGLDAGVALPVSSGGLGNDIGYLGGSADGSNSNFRSAGTNSTGGANTGRIDADRNIFYLVAGNWNPSNSRLTFGHYSRALDLEAMDTALTAYMSAIGSAI